MEHCSAEELSQNSAQPLVSIIVPVYNAAGHLPGMLNSLRRQTISQLEFLLINDGSSDNSYELCRNISLQDSRIKLINLERNRGVSVARNIGLEHATGSYISFVDSDDQIEPDMIEYLLRLIQYKHASVATCGIYLNYSDGRQYKPGKGRDYTASAEFVIDEINYGGDFTPYLVDKLFDRNLLEGLRFQEGVSIGEDYRFVIKALMRASFIVHGSEYKYHYFQNADSVTHRGIGNLKMVFLNRKYSRSTYELIAVHNQALASGALAYYMLQEMAVFTSMIKAREYNKMMAKSVQREIRRHLKEYLKLKRVPFYLKACAFLLSIHENFLSCPYQIIWKLKWVS